MVGVSHDTTTRSSYLFFFFPLLFLLGSAIPFNYTHTHTHVHNRNYLLFLICGCFAFSTQKKQATFFFFSQGNNTKEAMQRLALAPAATAAAVFSAARRHRVLVSSLPTSARYAAACQCPRRCASSSTITTTTETEAKAFSSSSSAVHASSTVSSSSAAGAATDGARDTAAAAAASPRRFIYAPRLRYTAPWRSKTLTDFLVCHDRTAISIAHTYHHAAHNITVTLIPLRHFAHPEFFRQVDDLCAQHESVLMEGRMPLTGAPYSTMVPPRARVSDVRPPEHEDDEGWEPREVEKFFQPFSWGVADSPYHTVVHAADKYDYERLPWWCSVRFNAPVLGSLGREQHCLNMIYPLNANMYKTFAIPWGAAHMPVFHEMLLDNGFENVGMCSLVVLNKVDGIISEGEFSKMQRWQRRRARRIYYVYAVGFVAFFSFLYSYVSVDYRQGPRVE